MFIWYKKIKWNAIKTHWNIKKPISLIFKEKKVNIKIKGNSSNSQKLNIKLHVEPRSIL